MKHIHAGNRIPSLDPCVMTIGKFEGLHLGHRTLIETSKQYALENSLPLAIFTFDPHPYRVLSNPDYHPLYTPAERAYLLNELCVDYLIEYPFDCAFASMTPEAFCKLVFNTLSCRILVVGEDYRFGRGRAGSSRTLFNIGRAMGREVVVVPEREDGGIKVSTSQIRETLSGLGKNAIETASFLLGKPFFIMGTVQQGCQIGRTLGFPTLNLRPDTHKFLPPDGVYVTRTSMQNNIYYSVTNIGIKPTISADSGAIRTVESFLFDFGGDAYGRDICVEFISFIRPEKKFINLEQLQKQIHTDIEAARQYFRG